MKSLYNLSIHLMIFGMKVFSLFDSKTKKGVRGRKESLKIVREKIQGRKVLWMHAASLGEYEQGLPVLEKLKEQFPEHKTLVTFFSPSGYENVKKRKQIADAVCYLPFDRKKDVKEFVSTFDTEIFFTVKYDYWYNLLEELKNRGTKNYVISALFYEHQVFFESYGKWFAKQLQKNIDWFFHQTIKSQALAKKLGLNNSTVSGDTRFDRVKQFLDRDNHLEFIEEFKANQKLIVLGSSWQAEEDIAQVLVKKLPETKIVIAPHDLHRVPHLKSLFPNAILYSGIVKTQNRKTENETNSQFNDFANSQILIIDSIGKLSKLYSYADLAVVGGGFHSAGLHNILEAAVYGVPVIFGNQYKKNPEADALIEAKGGKSFDDFVVASAFITEVIKKDSQTEGEEKSYLKEMSEKAFEFVNSQPNSTEIIVKKIMA
ncbi:3-deoxy-D-manno-octulosonic acid transferase [Epilithonimonas hispanica]|uniref:3-deoxy-D-manno-octulosonic acid transferase n=1 Tax=Epilithonimonas hispanica TaxID=358687 RepID=A0A3D9D241_9FLAO|nr:glycosyltransferase N-terminal domain-containing protein [Epilithonimonas hispanica]REC72082.1 3-deoxy-D-manno-octulosonic acid transferase [Epilithonimonas hispanica]